MEEILRCTSCSAWIQDTCGCSSHSHILTCVFTNQSIHFYQDNSKKVCCTHQTFSIEAITTEQFNKQIKHFLVCFWTILKGFFHNIPITSISSYLTTSKVKSNSDNITNHGDDIVNKTNDYEMNHEIIEKVLT